jgi:heptosyltransferase-3
MSARRKVLVYLFGSLGDTIVAIPALRAVRTHFPAAEIVLLQNMQPGNLVTASEVIPSGLIDRFLSYDNTLKGILKITGFYRLWNDLRRERFQTAVYLVISERPKSSVSRDRLFFKLSGIRQLIGFRAFSNEELYPVDDLGHPALTEQEAARKLRRLELDGFEVVHADVFRQPLLAFAPEERGSMERWLATNRKKSASRLVAIAPGCKTSANQWPVENFVEIGRRLVTNEDCELVIIGGKAETQLGEQMIGALGGGINAAGRFSVRESAILLSLCDLYIGLDTGTTHLATAVDTPCLAVYGERNNPGQWFPLGSKHSVVIHKVECAGCRLFECPVDGHPCMSGISVESVWKHLIALMHELDGRHTLKLEVSAV